MEEQGEGQYHRQHAVYFYASAQECLDYASLATDPKLREAWKRVADCNQDLAIALEQLAGVIDQVGAQNNSN